MVQCCHQLTVLTGILKHGEITSVDLPLRMRQPILPHWTREWMVFGMQSQNAFQNAYSFSLF